VCHRLGRLPQLGVQVGADRVVGLIALELLGQRQQLGQGISRAAGVGQCDQAVEGENRVGAAAQQLIVEQHELRPVGGGKAFGFGVQRGDGCLQLVRAGATTA